MVPNWELRLHPVTVRQLLQQVLVALHLGTYYAYALLDTDDPDLTDPNCRPFAEIVIIVNPLPTAAIEGDLIICEGETTTLTASGGTEYLWSTGETTASIEVSTAGDYTVTVTDANGCSDDETVSVTVNPLPTAAIEGDLIICEGETTTLTASGGTEYLWSTGETTASIEVSTAGDYTVTVTDANGCSDDETVSVTVNPLPTAAIEGDLIICEGETTTLTASGGTEYLWSTGETTASIEVSTAGDYTVTVTDANGCSDDETVSVTVNPLPTAAIEGDLIICEGETTTLTASGGTEYLWSTGETTASIEVSTAGDYTVTVTDANGCSDDETVSVTVNPLPTAAIEGDLIICEGETTTLTASGGTEYLWSTGETTASIEVSTAGDYTVTVTDANGCSDDETVSVTVNPLPTAAIEGDLIICEGETTTLTASGGTEYLWSTGETTASIEVSTAGDYTVTVTDANGCSDDETVSVTVNPLPTAAIEGDLIICEGETTTLTASGGTEYLWSTGETTASIEVSTAGDYTVTVTDANGCSDDETVSVTVNPLPTAAIEGDLIICEGETTTLTASGGTEYLWSTGETTASIEVSTAGDYTVTVTDANGCSDDETVSVTVNPLPTAAIEGDLIICEGETTTLTASGGTEYLWSTGETTASIEVSTAGDYTVTVTDANGCSDDETVSVTVNPLPTAAIEGDLIICEGETTTLTASGGTEYLWSTGETTASIEVSTAGDYTVTVTDANGCSDDETVSVTVNPLPTAAIEGDLIICEGETTTLTASGGTEYLWSTGETTASIEVSTAGDYTVTVTDANGCSDDETVSVTVNPLPTAAIEGDLIICEGETTTLTASGGTEYLWSTGETTASIEVSTAGDYTVTVTDANGCSDDETVSVTVNPLPTAAIEGDLIICEGETTTLTASGGTEYLWSTGETTASIEVSTAGDYTVTVTDANGCSDDETVSVTVNPLPTAAIEGDLIICEGETTTLTASGGTEYLWSTGETTASIEVSTAGDYTVTVTDANGCSDDETVSVTVNPLPTAAIEGDLIICEGETTTLTASGGTEYLWSTGETTASIEVSTAGDYTVTVTDANGCSDDETVSVTVNPLPTAAIEGDLIICEGETTTLTASGGTEYLWSTGETTASIEVSTAGDYTVTVTDANGCSDDETVSVTVNPLPTAAIEGDLIICEGETTTLTASGGTEYLWSTGETTASIEVSTAGDYTVTVTDANGCSDDETVSVTVNPLPTAAIEGDLIICEGETTTLTASGGTEYLWSTGETTASIEVSTAGDYTVTVTDANGCSDDETVSVTVNPLPTAAIEGDLIICEGETTTLTASGGTEYLWSTGETTASIEVSTAGDYTVTVTDANGCSDDETVSVTVNPLPTAAIEGDLIICEGETTTLTASGGTEYLWSTGETTASIEVSTAGDYTVTVTDANGCSDDETVSVTVNPLPTAAIEGDLIICEGETTTLTASGGTEYLWSTGETTASIEVSTAGDYTVTVTDANGCSDDETVSVTVNPLPTAAIEGDLIICEGETTTLTASGGTEYLWSTGETTASIEVSTAGDYTVTVTDANGCSDDETVSVTVNPLPTAAIEGDLIICEGETTTLTASGGTEYLWSTGETTASIEVSTAGDYTVTVTDANGCSDDETVSVTVNPLPEKPVFKIENASCDTEGSAMVSNYRLGLVYTFVPSGSTISEGGEILNFLLDTAYSVTVKDLKSGCESATSIFSVGSWQEMSCSIVQDQLTTDHLTMDGVATATPFGGTAPFTYLWDNGETTQTATKLTYGMHSVTITDANGCQTMCQIDIAKELYCWVNLIQHVTEYGGKDGAARVSGNGGYRPFTFQWDDGSMEATNRSLTAGIHTVTITDATGATSECTITIMEPTGSACDKFTSEVEQDKLTTDHLTKDGEATVTPYGGKAPYTYYWDNGETSQTATTLTYGMHWVKVTDANGCESVSYIDIAKELYCWVNRVQNVTEYGGKDGAARVSGNGGYRPFTFKWDDGSTEATNRSLTAGKHYVTITDATGATSQCSITITQPGPEVCDGVDNDGDGKIDEGFDADMDGIPDCFDECDDRLDTDQDGVPDCSDKCPNGDDTEDSDGDGVPDACDVEECDGLDNDGDGKVDEGFDADMDGIADCFDDCDNRLDTDQDGVPDCSDKCPGYDDNLDTDGDGTPDCMDNCDDTVDTDGDGIADCYDEEIDSPCPDNVNANGVSMDTDLDGVPDCLDKCPGYDDAMDSDGDGTPDCLG
ncbi:hypothetical protein NYZ99_12660 [Maribacter litopenaei]|uniref:PKD/Chitinase domain-containing protein n=1 Tax=Maribacter litopenaei TaxID=2976127 RepID=A0ABY5YC26_9FLAO|nr:hypothetical protein [Maribacter litopenaei]UWX56603.1 hypothetical protein NYZ99_12660 [Maribacter litopenaei]